MKPPPEVLLERRIARMIAFRDGDFEALALDIHRWQLRHDPVLASLVDVPAQRWFEIPAVPVALFRSLDVGVTNPADARATFHTSGTTGQPGVHRLSHTRLYDQGAVHWMRACVPNAPSDVIALLHAPADHPSSSLSHMVARFGRCWWMLYQGRPHRQRLHELLHQRSAPVFLASTAFALADWLEGPVPALPPGSVLMVTGGFKGHRHDISHQTLYRDAQRLGATRVVTEYGMTELSSQLWGTPSAPFMPPPWLRVLAVDPTTGAPLPPERSGQLRFFDLCNLPSTLAIETLDAGVVHADGSVSLEGRLPGAAARGCSLDIERAWEQR